MLGQDIKIDLGIDRKKKVTSLAVNQTGQGHESQSYWESDSQREGEIVQVNIQRWTGLIEKQFEMRALQLPESEQLSSEEQSVDWQINEVEKDSRNQDLMRIQKQREHETTKLGLLYAKRMMRDKFDL